MEFSQWTADDKVAEARMRKQGINETKTKKKVAILLVAPPIYSRQFQIVRMVDSILPQSQKTTATTRENVFGPFRC